MDQSLTLYSWFTCLLIIVIIVIDVLLGLKFRRYYRASGFGIVTAVLISLVFAQALAALIYGTVSLIIILSRGKATYFIYLSKDIGISWLISSTLLHVMAISFLRMYSVSFGNKFLKFIRSKANIGLVIVKIWFVSISLTLVSLTSATPMTYSVFYIGLCATGILAVLSFFVTIDTSLNTSKSVLENEMEVRNEVSPNRLKNNYQVVKNPRKTYTLFSGLIISFMIFLLPAAIPNLVFNLKGQHLTHLTSLIVSLWLLLGVVFNSFWILFRLRSTINDTTGFYARWTLDKTRDNSVFIDWRNDGSTRTRMLAHAKLLEENDTGPETECEMI